MSEKNYVDYIQEIDGLETDIEYLKRDIEQLEKEKEYYRIEANKDHKEFILEFVNDLKNTTEYIFIKHSVKIPMSDLIKKWEDKL